MFVILNTETQRHRAFKQLYYLVTPDYKEESIGSVSFASSKIYSLRFCVSAF